MTLPWVVLLFTGGILWAWSGSYRVVSNIITRLIQFWSVGVVGSDYSFLYQAGWPVVQLTSTPRYFKLLILLHAPSFFVFFSFSLHFRLFPIYPSCLCCYGIQCLHPKDNINWGRKLHWGCCLLLSGSISFRYLINIPITTISWLGVRYRYVSRFD